MVTIREVSSIADVRDALLRMEKEAASSLFSGAIKVELSFKRGLLQTVRNSAESLGLPADRKNTGVMVQ